MWHSVNIGLSSYARILAIDPSTPTTLFAAGDGVYKSTDSGGNWNAVNNGLDLNNSFTALAIDPATPTTLYAGTYGGVFKSTDGGGSWSAVIIGIDNVG